MPWPRHPNFEDLLRPPHTAPAPNGLISLTAFPLAPIFTQKALMSPCWGPPPWEPHMPK